MSVQEAERKAVLERKEKAGAITPDERNELTTINKTDKARDQAIKAVCTDGNKGGSGCGALIGPAQEVLKKYGENVTYSLVYKDLYPQDAKNLESVLQGLDAGSISRDQAITAIAQASGVSWETAASRYDTAMQAQALTAALAGTAGLKGVTEKPAGSGTTKPSQPATPNKGNSQAETKPSGAENAISQSESKLPWNSWQNYPKQTVDGRQYAQIGDRLYSQHAVDRMQLSGLGSPAGTSGPGRNITPNMVEHTIKTGTPETSISNGIPRTVYWSGDVGVVTENKSNVIVAILRRSGQ
ncbi:DUF6862 domain-containing protein [Serratia symbiotica]|uniref:DUF6862 domain-containing protein n=1 Tax=Serratia symbiotica TaxID=138074 RepID=UPI003463D9B6